MYQLFDTECFPNYWLLKARRMPSGEVFSFRLRAGERFDSATVAAMLEALNICVSVSFNGNHYDVPIIGAALAGWTCEQLKWLSDEIIVNDKKHWEIAGLPRFELRDHIDIREVLPGAGSQKLYAGRIHYKTMQDLPYEPNTVLTEEQIAVVDDYCENDLGQIEAEYLALAPQIKQREELSKRYGFDLRSKSDAQLAEAVLRRRCEEAVKTRLYKAEIDWNLSFRYEPPAFLSFTHPELVRAFDAVRNAIFRLGPTGAVEMPAQLNGMEIAIGCGVYRMGIGGLHSSEKAVAYRADEHHLIRDCDVASYYPNLILNSGKYPGALGPAFLSEFDALLRERLRAKDLEKKLKKETGRDPKLPSFPEGYKAHCENEGGKIMINGTFGKTGSPYSILFAPEMLIQTTITGQLALLMLIEWHEHYSIPVISANTDGIVMRCPRALLHVSEYLVNEWQQRTGLEMEATEYRAMYSRDVNNYVAVKLDGDTKRKGEYSKAGLVEKKNPDAEICGDVVAEYLSKGTPLLYTIGACRDIRKFVTIQKVAGGGVKLWGEGPREKLVRDMAPTIIANGWTKAGHKWERGKVLTDATTAYRMCFEPQIPEMLGKVIRWYYAKNAPGPIIYNTNGNQVGSSYGARPLMTLPDEFPDDVDYDWYMAKCEVMLRDLGAA